MAPIPTTSPPRWHTWTDVVIGGAWLVVAAWVWTTRADTLLAGHPAYAVAITVAGLVGALVLVMALRTTGGGPRRRWVAVTLRVVGGLLSVVVLTALVWLRPFPASEVAVAAMEGSDGVRVHDSPTRITLAPDGPAPTTGLVFQPGARVDPRAYVALLAEVARSGHLVVVVKQPLGIGFTALGTPEEIIEDHPEVDRWAVGGHSLGGVVAGIFARDHDLDGLLLWASFPSESLARRDLVASSISGTEDLLTTPRDIEDSRADLPPGSTFVAVEGAVHAFFGDYGEQPGDGRPTVSRDEAQARIVAASVLLLDELSRPTD
ncbi:Alpha/beta hydrolase family protein [Nocardioides alpinus]|nr:alpha/beta hydrolase [Nocardioides alpinus]SFB40919.1 Alpha/beta hydrolase family protein [Nocardioides alpinus]